MGLFDSLKKVFGIGSNKYNISITTEIPDYETQLQEKVNEIHRKAKNSVVSRNGLRPNEILFLSYSPKFSTVQTEFPQYWYYDMAIDKPRKLLDRLESQGFIKPASAAESLASLKVPELKEMLAELSLPVTGKKADLVERLCTVAPDEFLEKKVPIRKYSLTELGQSELDENEYVLYFGKSYKYGFDIWSMNQALQDNPSLTYKDIIWQHLMEEKSKLPLLKATYDHNTYVSIIDTLGDYFLENERYEEAFECFSEATYYRIVVIEVASLRTGIELTKKGILDLPEYEYFHCCSVGNFESILKALNITNEEMYVKMVEYFSSLPIPHKSNNVIIPPDILSPEDVASIIMFSIEKNEEAVGELFKKAEKALLTCRLPVWDYN